MSGRRRSAPDVVAKAKALEAALEAGGDRLDPAARDEAQKVLARTAERLQLGGERTVVALAGATGSGKSSLFNALSGMEIADVGARRPLTAEAMACVWGDDDAGPLLDWLGVPPGRRVGRETVLDADREAPLRGLVLLDLPDHDSTAVGAPARGRPARRARRPARLGGRPAEVRRRVPAPRVPAPARGPRRGDARGAQPGRPAGRDARSRPAARTCGGCWTPTGCDGPHRDGVGAPRRRGRRAPGADR